MVDPLSLAISTLSLIVAATTAWLTLFRRGTVRMTNRRSFSLDGINRFGFTVSEINSFVKVAYLLARQVYRPITIFLSLKMEKCLPLQKVTTSLTFLQICWAI